MTIDSLLKPFQRFGIHLGLERIEQLLADLGNIHHRVPIIHVAGTNGKGSICAYLSSVLTEAGYRVGRYTSPHLVDWTERICLNEQPISSAAFQEVLLQVQAAINPETESPTQFEVITATAWLYFAQQQVDVAVMEVGLGGRLDATNVCNSPLVSIITSISREHWQNLGSTLADIAREKAGILKSGCPAVIGSLPLEAKEVVASRINQLNCSAVWVEPAKVIEDRKERREELSSSTPFTSLTPHPSPLNHRWASYQGIEYPLPLLGKIQLTNSAVAIACLQVLQQQGWKIPQPAIQTGMAKTHWLGRLQWVSWNNHQILIDGAHNPAAAKALRQYIDAIDTSVTWVMGILSTKDHADIFEALLRPADQLYLVPVPDHSSANPQALATLAQNLCPNLADCRTFPELFNALETAFSTNKNRDRLVVLCGSLYLVGHFLKHL